MLAIEIVGIVKSKLLTNPRYLNVKDSFAVADDGDMNASL
jgi:hypothetical protein